MRKRGVESLKRIEIWCPTRTVAKDLYSQLKRKAAKKGHISLGRSYKERTKEREQSKRKDHPKYSESDQEKLIIMSWNARSVRKKVEELKKVIDDKKMKIICIQEASLPKDTKYHPKFKEYQAFNISRDDRTGGGLLTLVHNSLYVEDNAGAIANNLEYMKLKIKVNNDFSFTLFNVYIPAQSLKEADLDILKATGNEKSIIVGDFNSKHHSWSRGSENRNGPILHRWLHQQGLILLNRNKEPTYQSPSTGSLSTLDLSIISPNFCNLATRCQVGEDLGSDHFPVFCELRYSKTLVLNSAEVHGRYNVKKADWSAFLEVTEDLATNRGKELKDVEDIFHCAAERAIPIRKRFTKRKCMNGWWNKEIEGLRKRRQHMRKKWKVQRTKECRAQYNKCNAILRKAILGAKRTSWRNFVSTMNSNTPSSTVWKRFRSTEGRTNDKICHIKDGNGQLRYTDEEKAEAFNAFYKDKSGKKIGWPLTITPLEQRFTSNFEQLLLEADCADVPFTMKELKDAVKTLRSAAPGMDNIHNEMLKHCSEEMLNTILQLYNNIWLTGKIPQSWKISTIIPLLKPGKDKVSLKSYRPVALTSCLGKLLEKMVTTRLTWRLEIEGSLSTQQFGYRRLRSTNDALLFVTNKIYEGFQGKKSTIVVLLDFEGAFDQVPHSTILLQCINAGIRGKLLKYIADFLENRLIQVIVNGVLSSCLQAENGIPQGGVISSVLFNIAVRDLQDCLPSNVFTASFADDFSFGTTAIDPDKANESMQQALSIVAQWCSKWSLKISTEKTECAFFTRRNCHNNFIPHLTIENVQLRVNNSPKLLGVVLDRKLRWKDQTQDIVEQCSNRLNALKAVASRAWGADTVTLRMFYLAYIRSKMTYCCEVWGGAASTHLQKLERIQSAALRICLGCPKTTPVAAMQIELNVEPLDLFINEQIWKKKLKNDTLPQSHPCSSLALNKAKQSFTYKTSLLALSMPRMDPQMIPAYYDVSPWEDVEVNVVEKLPSGLTKADSPQILKVVTLEMLAETYHNHVKIYTDGSVEAENRKSGAGYFNSDSGEVFYAPSNSTSSMDSELLALNAALMSCLEIEEMRICILTDSKAALEALKNPLPTDCYYRLQELKKLLKLLDIKGKSITLQWIPGHCGVSGNERADAIAKQAASLAPSLPPQDSLKRCKSQTSAVFRKQWVERWRMADTGRHLFNFQKEPTSNDHYTGISRETASFAAKARTGHIVTGEYLFRFHLSDSPNCAKCSSIESLSHILLECPAPNKFRTKLRNLKVPYEDILKSKKLWSLASAAYFGHRAIGVT